MFVAFLVLGFVPLLSYVAFDPIHWPGKFNPIFMIACILTGLSLFLLGAIASKFTHLAWWKGGLQVCFSGGFVFVLNHTYVVLLVFGFFYFLLVEGGAFLFLVACFF